MESRLIKFIFDKKDKNEVYEWASFLNSKNEAVIEILEEECVFAEEAYIEEVEDCINIYFYWAGEDLDKASEISQKNKNEINNFHRNFILTFRKKAIKIENLFRFHTYGKLKK